MLSVDDAVCEFCLVECRYTATISSNCFLFKTGIKRFSFYITRATPLRPRLRLMFDTYSVSAHDYARVVLPAALTAVDVVSASANSWDPRTAGNGCAPDACVASNAIDGSVEYDSRWSCKSTNAPELEACELTVELSAPQDIKEIRVALWKGDERTRLINVLTDGVVVTTIESSGTTEGYEPYPLTATQVSTIVLQAAGSDDETYNGWLSILDVRTGKVLQIGNAIKQHVRRATCAN